MKYLGERDSIRIVSGFVLMYFSKLKRLMMDFFLVRISTKKHKIGLIFCLYSLLRKRDVFVKFHPL